MEARLSQGHRREKALCCRNPQPKVSLTDKRPPRRAYTRLLALTSCQQLHKVNHTAGISRVSKPPAESWVALHHHRGLQPT